MQVLGTMHSVPLKWESHGDTIQGCEACIPPTNDMGMLRKGVFLDLNNFDEDQTEWS